MLDTERSIGWSIGDVAGFRLWHPATRTAAVFGADAAEEVPGVVVSIHAEMLEEALASLDEVEGVDGGLFQRVVIDVGGLSCWAYHWPESTEAFHRIQRWPRGGEL